MPSHCFNLKLEQSSRKKGQKFILLDKFFSEFLLSSKFGIKSISSMF